jgi:DNA-binding NarL/FixJ family response regulator
MSGIQTIEFAQRRVITRIDGLFSGANSDWLPNCSKQGMALRRNEESSAAVATSAVAETEQSPNNPKARVGQSPAPAPTADKLAKAKDNRRRVLLVEDHAVVRFGIAQLINRQADLVVCGEEEDASRALSAIATARPDLVIADISLKDSSGLELMRNIKAQYPGLAILVVSVHDESIYAEIAFRAGALGYLMKQEALDKILVAIRRVLDGNIYVSDVLASRMLQQQVRGQRDINESPVRSLSDRELEVFQLIGQWKKTKEIAQELHLSVKTVEYYREQIKRKLNLRDAAELTQHATSWVQRANSD